jgi:hypothetical protein
MHGEPIRYLVVTAGGLALWQLATSVLATPEPWDSPDYLAFYLAALGLCGVFGFLFPGRAWRWGFIVIFAQLPVMIFHSAALGPLLVLGLAVLAVQALPAILAAAAASALRQRRHRN